VPFDVEGFNNLLHVLDPSGTARMGVAKSLSWGHSWGREWGSGFWGGAAIRTS